VTVTPTSSATKHVVTGPYRYRPAGPEFDRLIVKLSFALSGAVSSVSTGDRIFTFQLASSTDWDGNVVNISSATWVPIPVTKREIAVYEGFPTESSLTISHRVINVTPADSVYFGLFVHNAGASGASAAVTIDYINFYAISYHR
jgi:hypothetical protein